MFDAKLVSGTWLWIDQITILYEEEKPHEGFEWSAYYNSGSSVPSV